MKLKNIGWGRIASIIKIATVINTELKYQFLKNTRKFQISNNYELLHAKAYLKNTLTYPIITNMLIYGVLSSIFGETALRNYKDVGNILLSIFTLIFILGIMTDSQFFRGIWEMNLIGPLRALPIKVHSLIIPISTFIYNESFLFAISLPAAIILYLGLHNPYILLIMVAYTILFIYAARLISLILGILWSKYNTNRITKRLYLSQIMQVLFILIFVLSIQIVTNPFLLGKISFPSFLFTIFPLNYYSFSKFYIKSFAIFGIEFLPIFAVYQYAIRIAFTEKFEIYIEASRENANNTNYSRKFKTRNQLMALMVKDLKSIARKRGALSIIILPAIFIIPILVNLASVGTGTAQITGALPYISAIFLISFIELVSLEGKGAWHLSTLPITRRIFFFSKFFEVIIIAFVYYLIILIAFISMKGASSISMILFFPFYILLISTIIFTGGGFIIKSIPEGTSIISVDAIGGRALFIKVMVLSLPLIVLNALLFALGPKYLPIFTERILDSYIGVVLIDMVLIMASYYLLIRKISNF